MYRLVFRKYHFYDYSIELYQSNKEGYIQLPTNEELKALNEKLLKERAVAKRKQQQSKARNSSNNTTWEHIGPIVKYSYFDNEPVDYMVNVYAMAQSTSNPTILYCVTEAAGVVYKTIDKGDNWFSVSDEYIFNFKSREIEVDPTNPDIVYLSTRGAIYKSSTGGNNWNVIYEDVINGNVNTNFDVYTFLISPDNPNIIIAATTVGILKTTDGGANWTNVFNSFLSYDVRFKPGDTQTVYALMNDTNKPEFYKSIDGGDTWSIRNTGWPNESAASSRGARMTTSDANPDLIYAFIGANYDAGTNGIYILKSLDSGETWDIKVDPDNTSGIDTGQGFYDWDIEASDVNPDIVFFGTQERYVNFDGFETETFKTNNLGHADVQEALFNGDDLWVANDGGVILFDDLTFNNFEVKSKGIDAMSSWSFDQGWNKDVQVASHYHDGTSFLHEDSIALRNYFIGGGEPRFSVIFQPAANIVGTSAALTSGMYDLRDEDKERILYGLLPTHHSNSTMHPTYYNRHFGVANELLNKRDELAGKWTTIFEYPNADEIGTVVQCSRANPNVIYTSSTSNSTGSHLYKSADNGANFIEIPQPIGFSATNFEIAVSNEDENILFIGGDNQNSGADVLIQKTLDGGQSWINLWTPTLTGHNFSRILPVDGTDGGIYLVCNRGIFYRNNTLEDWVLLADGFPTNIETKYIRPFYRDNAVRIGTERGFYGAALYDTPQLSDVLIQPSVNKSFTDCPRDTFYFDDFSVLAHAGATWSWSFPGASYVSNPNIINPRVVYPQSGKYDVTLTVTKDGQAYTKTIEEMVEIGSENICINLEEIAGNAVHVIGEQSSYVLTNDAVNLTTDTISMSIWVKRTVDLADRAGIIFSNGSAGNFGLNISVDNQLGYTFPNSSEHNWQSGLVLPENEWTHIALVITPAETRLYKNGEVAIRDNSATPLGELVLDDILYIGGDQSNSARRFIGDFDEVGIWTRALTEKEIKELMHLIKDPSQEEEMFAYFQFNESDVPFFNKAGNLTARFTGNSSLVPSSAPIGGGHSDTQTESNGTVSFTDTGLETNFISQNGAEVVVTKIENAPYYLHGFADGDIPFTEQYWTAHRFGSGEYLTNLTLTLGEDLVAADATNPSRLALYGRIATGDSTWTFIDNAAAVDPATHKVTFNNIKEFGQYVVVKNTQAVIRTITELTIDNTTINQSTDSSYQIAAANLTTNLTITAPSHFQISLTAGSGFTNSLTLAPTAGAIPKTTIYVRFSPALPRLYYEQIVHSSTGANSVELDIQGLGYELDRVPGNAINFDGTNDYIEITSAPIALSNQITIEFWANYEGTTSNRNSVIYGFEDGGAAVLDVRLPNNSQVRFYAGNAATGTDRIDNTVTLEELDGWHFWSFMKDVTTGTMKIYRDGVLLQTQTGSTKVLDSLAKLRIGSRGSSRRFNGQLDELRIWNTVRTESEIRASMHLTLTGNEPNLVTYFQFNETDGNVQDYISNFSGELKNGASFVVAPEPVGGGFSNTQSTPSGSVTFTNTNLSANFDATNDEIVVSKIALAPNDITGIGAGEAVADQQYWVLRPYGGNGFNADLTFTLEEDLTAAEETTPNTLKLYGRNYNGIADWTLITSATSVDAANDKVTFDNVSTFEQYLITRNPFPQFTISPTDLDFGNVNTNTDSVKSYTVTATGLTNDLTLTAPANYQISLTSEGGFGTNLSISPTAGEIANTTIYVQFSPTQIAEYFGDILHSSIGATDQSLSVDGRGVHSKLEVWYETIYIPNGGSIDFGDVVIDDYIFPYFSIKNTDLGALTLTEQPYGVIASNKGTSDVLFFYEYRPALFLEGNEETETRIYFRPTDVGAKSITLTIPTTDPNENPYTFQVTFNAIEEIVSNPVITTSSSLTHFDNQLVGAASAVQSYTISGSDLADNIVISPPLGFELSLNNNAGFSTSTISLAPTDGIVETTTIYVRFKPAASNEYMGSILNSSTGATTQIVSVSGGSYKTAETIPGNLLDFNGTTDYVEIDASGIPVTNTFTVEFWTNYEGAITDRNSIVYARPIAENERQINVLFAWRSKMYFDAGNETDGYDRIEKTITAEDVTGWHHWAYVKDAIAGTMKIYRDGELWLEGTGKTKPIGTIERLLLGSNGTREFEGQLEEFRLWNTARSQSEIRENIHLTQLSTDNNLLIYHQFNEFGYSAALNVKGKEHGQLVNSTKRLVSTRPLGGGFSATQTETNGTVSFANTDVEIDFTSQTGAEVVVSKINLAPNSIPTGLTRVFDTQYWAIHRYGTGSFTGNITFKVAEDLTDGDEQSPDEILLYGRDFNSDTDWTLVDVATTVDAANDKATFNNISNFDQFIIVSSSDGVAEPTDCIPDINYEDRNDMPSVTSSTTYIRAGNLTGTGDVVIQNGQDVLYRAKEYIQLLSGFKAETGAKFNAKIEDCNIALVEDTPVEQIATARNASKIANSELETLLDINVYPNPFEMQFFINYRINKETLVTFQLFDLFGRKVADILMNKRRIAGAYQAQFTNRNLTAGTYILRIQVDNQVSQRKVVMNNQR